jgi:predicted anti-sigma-YlaC factor YlaD
VAPVPDLSAAILAAVPRRAGRSALFVALAGVGAVQLILGLAQVGGSGSGDHVHGGPGAISGHLWHESAAWNVAIGAGYLFLAVRRSRPTGLVPMLTAFVGMLLLLSVNDLTAARVDGTRLVSHGFVILGYVLVVALSRADGGAGTPPGARDSGWRVRFSGEDDGVQTAPPRLRLVPGQPGPLTASYSERRAA